MNKAQKSILIVEGDKDHRDTLKNFLSQKYKIYEAIDEDSARTLIDNNQFDLIISDMFPGSEGVSLLTWAKITKPSPIILMIAFAQILETQQAHDLGADDFITKPFQVSELQAKINKIFKEDQQAAGEVHQGYDKDFCRVPIDDFISEKELKHNIFIKLGDDRYVKVLHRGGKINPDRIRTYKEKGVYHLYIRQEDFRQILGFTVRVAKAAAENEGIINEEKKRHFLKFTGEMIIQNAFVVGVDTESLNSAKDFLESCMNVLVEDYDSFTLLEMLSQHTDLLYAHSLGVSAFSVMIGKQLGWRSPKTLFKLAFGGLFHDIGKKEISSKILNKPRVQLTLDERKELETHVTRGKQILESMRSAPTEAIRIAYEHHEDLVGHGYPRKLRRKDIHPLTLVVSVANSFCGHTIKNHVEDITKTGPEAIQAMELYEKDGLDTTVFKALKALLRNS